jgi:hypothetical protein
VNSSLEEWGVKPPVDLRCSRKATLERSGNICDIEAKGLDGEGM